MDQPKNGMNLILCLTNKFLKNSYFLNYKLVQLMQGYCKVLIQLYLLMEWLGQEKLIQCKVQQIKMK